MKTREWQKIDRRLDGEAFMAWLLSQPDSATWGRKAGCSCPLHAFVEDATGHSLNINSPEISEHWGDRETQSWPTPWWMTWVMRAVDHCGEGRIGKDEVLAIITRGADHDFGHYWLPMTPGALAA